MLMGSMPLGGNNDYLHMKILFKVIKVIMYYYYAGKMKETIFPETSCAY